MLVLTSKRVIYIRHNPVMGGWSSDWEYEYARMELRVPTVMQEGARWCIILAPLVTSPVF